MTPTLAKLLDYVRAHHHRAWISGGTIIAIAVYTRAGQTFEEIENAGSTLRSVREWLGY